VRLRGAWLAVLIIGGTLAGPPAQARDRSAAVRAAIEAASRAWMACVAKGRGDEVAALYAPDARLLPPGAPAVSGRSAIAAYWESRFDAGVAEVVIETDDVVAARDTATQVSAYRFKGKDTSTLAGGNAIAIWKRVDGRWLLWRSIWN
jgi:uncharacterized protein (TIGR02246 family)